MLSDDSSVNGMPVALEEPAREPSELRERVQRLRLECELDGAKTASSGAAGWLPWALAGALAFSWAGVAIRSYNAAPADRTALAPTGPAPEGSPTRPVNSAADSPRPKTAAPEPGSIQLEVKGYLIPAVQVAISPIDVAGQIIQLNVKEGEFFEKGAILAQIDPSSYQYAADEALQALDSSRQRLIAADEKRDELKPEAVRQVEKDQILAQLNEAKAQYARTQDELQRIERLRSGITQREVDQALNDNLAAKARYEKFAADYEVLIQGPRRQRLAAANAESAQARADVKSAEARLAQARWRLANCTIRAPIAGTALSKKSEVGNLVNPLAVAASAGSICEIADLSDLEVDLEIPERDISKLTVGQQCRVRADAYPDRRYEGRLDRIMPIANRAKSVVSVRVKVILPPDEKPGTYLKPEMGAVVSFLTPAKPAS